jgi:hypothetical protein
MTTRTSLMDSHVDVDKFLPAPRLSFPPVLSQLCVGGELEKNIIGQERLATAIKVETVLPIVWHSSAIHTLE